MTIHKNTPKFLFSILISLAILGLAACNAAPAPMDQAAEIAATSVQTEDADSTAVIESTESEENLSSEATDPVVVGENSDTSIIEDSQEKIQTAAVNSLTEIETEGLLFMREEEKLARDVYLALYDAWQMNIFQNIANSEQSHTDAVKALLDQYGLDDPMESDQPGVFVNPDLQRLYNQLVAQGSQSLVEALKVGAAIEEIDILDLEEYIAQTANPDIQFVYENLMKGSRNHLRSFVSTLQKQTGTIYEPQYLSEVVFESIVGSDIESGGNSQGRGRGS
jgi:hypothetical protein